MLLWGRAVPRLSLTSLGSIRAGVVGCTSQGGHHSGQSLTAQMVLPSLSSSQNTSPSHCCAPASHCHSGSFCQDIQPSSFHPSCLCLSPQLPPGWPQAKSCPPSAWHCTNSAWHPHTSTVLVLKHSHSQIRIAASEGSFQPLTLI